MRRVAPVGWLIGIASALWLRDHPDQAEFIRRHDRPILREMWLPIRLTPPMSAARIPAAPPGVSLDAAAPPRTHWPRLW